MSTMNHLFDLSEQICYVQCGYCNTTLLVSVPCSSLTMVVTVRCGHCTGLLSVNMKKACFVPLHLLASHHTHNEQKGEACVENHVERAQNAMDMRSSVVSSDNEDGDSISVNHTVNKPPEKRQRAPSAYNSFIREEIKRLKVENPNMNHKEAFSTAAKNWAYFPPIDHYEEEGDHSFSRRDDNVAFNSDVVEVHKEDNVLRKRKAPRNSICEKTPLE